MEETAPECQEAAERLSALRANQAKNRGILYCVLGLVAIVGLIGWGIDNENERIRQEQWDELIELSEERQRQEDALDARAAAINECRAAGDFWNGTYCTERQTFTVPQAGFSNGSDTISMFEDSGSDDGEYVIPGGTGYRVACRDGAISYSGGKQGACSHHGGVGVDGSSS